MMNSMQLKERYIQLVTHYNVWYSYTVDVQTSSTQMRSSSRRTAEDEVAKDRHAEEDLVDVALRRLAGEVQPAAWAGQPPVCPASHKQARSQPTSSWNFFSRVLPRGFFMTG